MARRDAGRALTGDDPETLSVWVPVDRGVLHQGDQGHLQVPGIDLEEPLDGLRVNGRILSKAHQGGGFPDPASVAKYRQN